MPVHEAIYERLKKVARAREITYYSDIAPLAGLDMATDVGRIRIAWILGEISAFEHEQGHPMLSAVVILKDDNKPGAGFFEFASQLGKYHGSSESEELLFWVSELTAVHSYWQSH